MTERAQSQNKQILDKVNEVVEKLEVVTAEVGKLSVKVGEINKELQLRPEMDKSEHENIKLTIAHHKEEIDALKANQRLIVVVIILAVVAAVMKIVIV